MIGHAFCPRCNKVVPVREEEFPGKVEFVCSICGFVIKVMHKHWGYLYPKRYLFVSEPYDEARTPE